MTAIIEDALVRNLGRLCEIETECFRDEAFTKGQMLQLLKEYNCVNLVARVDGTIAGFVIGMIYVDRKATYAHILTIDVSPAYRRKGIGQMLLQEIERIFKEKGVKASHLEVKEDNVAAINLYRKLGYEKIGKLRNYYGKANGIYFKKVLA
ncbi:MAG TPA: ribosomal protein S18-alanine N-acetyltransferase [Candidatus Acidoferrales bacterium]|nr:ribosomal protein S18-alanine N-acetyltransferase [Candidatus Acidoferrales bacterium]